MFPVGKAFCRDVTNETIELFETLTQLRDSINILNKNQVKIKPVS